jgi:hypothetical protein
MKLVSHSYVHDGFRLTNLDQSLAHRCHAWRPFSYSPYVPGPQTIRHLQLAYQK